MGMYLNPGNEGFKNIISTKYVDKTKLIEFTNNVINTTNKLICFTKPRRFGKSYAAKMLSAYYCTDVDSHTMFEHFNIAKENVASYEKYINKYNVIYLDITGFISEEVAKKDEYGSLVNNIAKKINDELLVQFDFCNSASSLFENLLQVVTQTHKKFVFIIDEWDAIYRELPDKIIIQKQYMNFLRGIFKNGNLTDDVVALAYMTGILPIKKYGHESAISDFHEYTMTNMGDLAEYIGFSEDEVESLSATSEFSIDELKEWYDGYSSITGMKIFNPNSIIQAVDRKQLDTYWVNTETYEQLRKYIELDYEGLRQDLAKMIGDEKIEVNIGFFQNDLSSISCKDDVYALLIHLGYLTYDYSEKKVYIPNLEIKHEFKNALSGSQRRCLVQMIKDSDELLSASFMMDEKRVADIIGKVHMDMTDPRHYNNEEALRAVIKTAYISAIDEYVRIEELPSGNGYVDIAFLPKAYSNNPAMVIELKWNKTSQTALDQIYDKKYPSVFENYRGDVLLIGINYDTSSKQHTCKIERKGI